MAVLMVQKNIIKRLIKEIQNAKRSGNMSIIPEQTSKYNSRLGCQASARRRPGLGGVGPLRALTPPFFVTEIRVDH